MQIQMQPGWLQKITCCLTAGASGAPARRKARVLRRSPCRTRPRRGPRAPSVLGVQRSTPPTPGVCGCVSPGEQHSKDEQQYSQGECWSTQLQAHGRLPMHAVFAEPSPRGLTWSEWSCTWRASSPAARSSRRNVCAHSPHLCSGAFRARRGVLSRPSHQLDQVTCTPRPPHHNRRMAQ